MNRQIMKRILFLFLAFVSLSTGFSASKEVGNKAVLNLITYAPDGTLLRSGYGFYISEEGQAVASFNLFKGAARAVAVDGKGKEYPVLRILGANSTYDLVKFTVAPAKKIEYLPLSTSGAEIGESLVLPYYSTNKKDKPLSAAVQQASDYNGYKYYDITAANEEKIIGCPLLDKDGYVVGVVQKNLLENASTACAIDARFAADLKITSVSALNADLRKIFIPKAIPSDEKEALAYLYMLGRTDSVMVATAMADFVAAYPDNVDIHIERAVFYASRADYLAAENDYKVALALCEKNGLKEKAAEVHYNFSKTLFASLSMPHAAESWTIARALEEAELACAVDTHSLYRVQRADCLFADKKYTEAYAAYLELAKGWMSTPEMYYRAARSLELSGGDSLQVIALLDSTVSRLPRPLSTVSARYVLERANRLAAAERYRDAVLDLNDYEKAVGPNRLPAHFYYMRHQMELSARMYQQAIDDIRRAVSLKPTEPLYRLEEAYILLRVGLYEETCTAASEALKLAPDNSAGHKLLGIASGELGRKDEALEHLRRAAALGDTDTDTYIKKYSAQ